MPAKKKVVAKGTKAATKKKPAAKHKKKAKKKSATHTAGVKVKAAH